METDGFIELVKRIRNKIHYKETFKTIHDVCIEDGVSEEMFYLAYKGAQLMDS
jgi:hypothetical protein